MIFDENYDKVLWLLVAGNKSDSDNICKLINYIPEDVYGQIQRAISSYYDGTLENTKGNIIFSTSLSNVGEFDCYITVKIELGKLYLNVCRWKEDKERIEEDYELVLKDISKETIDDMLYFDKKYIGKYSSEINKIKFVGYLTDVEKSSYDRKFALQKIPLGYIVSSSLRKRNLGKKYVSINRNMPDEIYVENFSSQEKIGGLIKKRKRNI